MTRRTPWTRRDVEGAGEEAPPPSPPPGPVTACLLLDGTTGALLLEVVAGCLELEGTY
jgi:hypothetical protein